jgi:hypothetical protein
LASALTEAIIGSAPIIERAKAGADPLKIRMAKLLSWPRGSKVDATGTLEQEPTST